MRRNVRGVLAPVTALTVVVALTFAALAAPPAHADDFSEGMSLAMQADVRDALPHLDAALRGALTPARHDVASCIASRFDRHVAAPVPAGLDRWAAEVLSDYRRYWTRVMMREVSIQDGERELGRVLAQRVGLVLRPDQVVDFDEVEKRIGERIGLAGWHALFGVTSPLREFMLWNHETESTYDVALPSGLEHVRVVWLDGFASLGWTAYATCERAHTGGWTKPDRLYAVASSYDPNAESFKVSYLMHEGQHFVDNRRCPDLEQPELEYRAKLVELANAHGTLDDLLEAFASNGSDDRDQPHPWANRRLMDTLAKRLLPGTPATPEAWKRLDPSAINAAARALLAEDDAKRLVARTCKAGG